MKKIDVQNTIENIVLSSVTAICLIVLFTFLNLELIIYA